jgi:hypothetical protein
MYAMRAMFHEILTMFLMFFYSLFAVSRLSIEGRGRFTLPLQKTQRAERASGGMVRM